MLNGKYKFLIYILCFFASVSGAKDSTLGGVILSALEADKTTYCRDLSDRYDVLRPGEHIMSVRLDVTSYEDTLVNGLIVYISSNKVVVLNHMESIGEVSKLVSRKIDRFPSDLDEQRALIRKIVTFYHPRIAILGSHFHEFSEDKLSKWLGTVEDSQELLRYCNDPQVSIDEATGTWDMEFHIIIAWGVLIRGTLSGDIEPFSVNQIKFIEVLPKGSFWNPTFG